MSKPMTVMDAPSTAPTDTDVELQVDHSDGRFLSNGSGGWLCCVPCEWLRHNNSVHQASLGVATLLVTSLLVASPVLFLISAVPASDVPRDCRIQVDDSCLYAGEPGNGGNPILGASSDLECSEPNCLAVAARLLSTLDRRVNPCTDFYQFSCGRWKETPSMGLSLHDMQNSVNNHIQQLLSNTSGPFTKLNQFYRSCLAVKGKPTSLLPIYAVLDELGGYLPPGSLGPGDLTPLLGRLLRMNGATVVDIKLEPDPGNLGKMAIFVDVPHRNQEGLEDKRLLELNNLLADFLPKKMNSLQRNKEIENILQFTSSLNKLYPRENNINSRLLRTDIYQRYNVTRLQNLFPIIKWGPFFEDVLSWNISESDSIHISSVGYLTSLTLTLSRFPKRVVHNALLILYAHQLSPLLNTSHQNQPKFCLHLTKELFPRAVAALYVRQFPWGYLQALERHTLKMFSKIKATLKSRIGSALWLDPKSRVNAVEKVDRLKGRFFVGKEREDELEDLMEDVQVDLNNFFGNVLHRYKQLRTISIDFSNDTRNIKIYSSPFEVNAFYEPRENLIVIPLALVAHPHLTPPIPLCVLHASLGTVLSHEILHGFDLHGTHFDAKGRLQSILSPAARLGLEARVDCVARQYSRVFRRQFDWNITRNENMADISALQTSHQAWQTNRAPTPNQDRLPGVGLGPRQLFFVASAQIYCSPLNHESYQPSIGIDIHASFPERVNGMMMNSPSFSEAFSCPLGTPMNPMKKCSTW